MNCTFRKSGDADERGAVAYVCERCGRTTKPTASRADRIFAECRSWPHWHEFGHWLALLLGELGVTKHRYVAAKRLLGLQPKCGCHKREERLNAWGGRVKEWLARLRKRPDPPPPGQRRAGEG